MVEGEAARIMMAGIRDALLGLAARGSILFGLALLGTRIGRSLGPERRHTVWLVFILLLAALPVVRLAAPLIRVPLLDPPEPPRAGAAVVVPTPPRAAVELVPGGGSSPAPVPWIPLVLAGTWLVGALTAAARPVAGRLALRRAIRSAAVRPGPAALLAELAEAAGVRGVSVLSHPGVTVPFTFGMRRPFVVLPLSWNRWSREKLASILLHELAHLRRGDARSDAAVQAVCALLWFNPLAWIARGFMRREAELSCDRHVLAGGIPRTGYAAALLDVARSARRTPFPLGGTALTGRGVLRQRITAVLSTRDGRAAGTTGVRRRARALCAVLCVLSPVVLLSISAREQDPLYGVWQGTSASRPFYTYRLALNEDGSGQTSLDALPDLPTALCRYVVEKRWKDAAGYTLYHLHTRWSDLPFPVYTLARLDPSRRHLELAEFPTEYPEGFLGPPGSEKHLVYVRR